MVIGILIDCEENIKNKVRYTFDQLFTVLGVPYQVLSNENDLNKTIHHMLVYYGASNLSDRLNNYVSNGGCILHIYSSRKYDLPDIAYLSTHHNDKIPFFYGYKSLNPKNGETLYEYAQGNEVAIQLSKLGNGFLIYIGFDIIMSAFFLLSRQEEISSKKRDIHQRFSADISIAFASNFLHEPVIDRYIKILQELLAIIKIPLIQKCYWPDNKDFAVCLTHDVDTVKKWTILRVLSQFLRSARLLSKFEIKQAVHKLISMTKSIIKRNDPYWTFEELIDLEQKYGFKSSFYFCASGKSYGISYNINKKIKKIVRIISKKGWEIGLHGSYDSYNDKEKLLIEKKVLEKVLGETVKGTRQHFLRFEVPKTWNIQEEVGLNYDVTFGYADQIGFRASTSFPFYPYDLLEDKNLSIMEIPLAVMDGTLFHYMKVSPEKAWMHTKNILETVEKTRGVAVLLWHNNVFDTEDNPGWGDVYYKSLEYLAIKNAWVTSGKEIAEWWIARNSFKCVDVEISKNKIKWTFKAELYIESIWFKINGLNNKNDVVVEGAKSYKTKNIRDIVYIEIEDIIKENVVTIIASV